VTAPAVAERAESRSTRRARDRARPARLAVAVAAPGLVTLLAFASVSPVLPALLYVAAVAAAAMAGGVVGGIVAAAASFAPFTYFFTPPAHTFSIADAADGGALAAFVLVALGLGQLLAREREARRAAERAAAHTARLEAAASALAAARTPQQVLDAVLTAGLAAAEARAGLIALLSADGASLEIAAHRGYEDGDTRLAPWASFDVADDLPLSEAVRTGTPVFLGSTAERDARFPRLAGLTPDSHGLACLPLVFEERTLGAVVLSFPSDQVFDRERRRLKEALAAQAAQALERARLDAAERALRERAAFLAEASELLASSLDYEQTLQQLADLVVPRLADWCSVDMLAADGSVQRLAVAHQDPGKVRYALELAERFPPDPEAAVGVAHVLRSGEPELIPLIDDALLERTLGADDERLPIVRELGLRSALTVPLVARGRTLGALGLVAAETVPPYTDEDLAFAQDLARRAAVAVDNARLHEEAARRGDAARALRHVADAVVLVDLGGRPVYWNAAAAALLDERDGALDGWQTLRDSLDAAGDESTATVPAELGAGERWLRVSRVDFDEGRVFALHDVTDELLLERTRSEFVATASHELRTPIAAVYGTFQTLLRPDVTLDPDQREQFLLLGLDESERLRRIVDDLLLAGQLHAGTPTIERVECDLRAEVERVLEVAAAGGGPTHALSASVEPAAERLECDPGRLRQVLANLVENAIKYSPDGGAVSVAARRDGDRVLIEVSDEGIGIPPAEHARIFDRFVRLDPSLSRGVGGTGLGLYISRELVERMGGTIRVRSAEGRGSTFTVALPGQPPAWAIAE
jgi:signal transduction histidine kinase